MLTFNEIKINDYFKCKNSDDLVKIVYQKTEDELDELDIDVYSNMIDSLKLLNNFKISKENFIIYNRRKWVFKATSDFTLGEYVDCLNYLKEKNYIGFCSVFLRKVIKKEDKFNDNILEDYTYNIEKRILYFDDLKMSTYYKCKIAFDLLVRDINSKFPIVFKNEEEKDEEEIEDRRTKAQLIHEKKIRESFQESAWEYIAYTLANEDIHKIDDSFNLNIYKVFAFLALRRKLELHNKTKS